MASPTTPEAVQAAVDALARHYTILGDGAFVAIMPGGGIFSMMYPSARERWKRQHRAARMTRRGLDPEAFYWPSYFIQP